MPNIRIHQIHIEETSATVSFLLTPEVGEHSVAEIQIEAPGNTYRGLNEQILGPAWTKLINNVEAWLSHLRAKSLTDVSNTHWHHQQGINITYIAPSPRLTEVHFLCQPGDTTIKVELPQLEQPSSSVYVTRAAWRNLRLFLDACHQQALARSSDPLLYLSP